MSKKNLSLELSSQPIFYVYTLIDPFTRKPFYIGKGKGKRMYKHVKYIKMCLRNEQNPKKGYNLKKFQKIKKILSLGGKVIHKKLKENLIESEAFRLEEKYIRYFGLKNLTNLTYGGEGEIPGEETRKKMSASMKGKKRSEETKRKISNTLTGTKHNLDSREKTSKTSFNNVKVSIYKNGKYFLHYRSMTYCYKMVFKKLKFNEISFYVFSKKVNNGGLFLGDYLFIVEKPYYRIISEETKNKIRKKHLGKKLLESTKEKIRKNNLGKNSGKKNGMFGVRLTGKNNHSSVKVFVIRNNEIIFNFDTIRQMIHFFKKIKNKNIGINCFKKKLSFGKVQIGEFIFIRKEFMRNIK